MADNDNDQVDGSENNDTPSETSGLDIASQSGQKTIAEAVMALGGVTLNVNYRDPEAEGAATSKSYAVGGTGSRENEDEDNAKYYYEQAKVESEKAAASAQAADTGSNVDQYLRVIPVTLLANGWSEESPYEQTVQIELVSSSDDYVDPFVKFVGVKETDEAAFEALSLISGGITNDGSITFYCYDDKPNMDLTLYLRKVAY
jgi:hypothetical protein